MAVLSVQWLQKTFGSRTLFDGVSFEVLERDRIGLVGANGTGKTTLMKMLSGHVQPDGGEVRRAKLMKIGCLEQAPALNEGESVYDFALRAFLELMALENTLEQTNRALLTDNSAQLIHKQHALREQFEREGGLTYKSRARAALLGLGFSDEMLSLDVCALSGGQLNKVMLARSLMAGGDLLLLDEPTNHLDIVAAQWLEGYLKSWPGAFIVISHDRYFLDQVTNRTLELSGGRLFASKGNYSAHVEKRENEKEYARRSYYNTQREIRRIYGIVEQQRRWNRERNIRTAESKLKQIERLKKTLVEPEKEARGIRFNLNAKSIGGNDALIAEDLGKAYGENRLFSGLSLHIRAGERVFLLGPNGCGKTTLMRILMNREPPSEGFAYFGAQTEPAYYEQDMRSMNPNNSVMDEVRTAYPKLTEQEIRNALASFLFRDSDVEKDISSLSGGEKARVQLLKLMLSGSNMLLLDEPTNHLDIASREALERALEEYEGTMLIVTHDRYLTNRIADRVLYMTNDGLTETIGGYDAFISSLGNAPSDDDDAIPTEKPRNDYHLKKERQSALNRARTKLTRAEEAVAKRELEIAELEKELLNAATDYQLSARISGTLDETRLALEADYESWERAEAELNELEEEWT